MSFQVQVIWNREFHFVNFSQPRDTIEQAAKLAYAALDLGDGSAVKDARVIDTEAEKVVWAHGCVLEKPREITP